MILKINGVGHDITPVSELSFHDFNKVVIENEVFDLKEYISLFADMNVKDLMEAEINTVSMPALHAKVFDVDIAKAIKNPMKTIEYGGQIHILKDMRISTFGKVYMFDMFYENFLSNKINSYELSLYGLSIYLASTNDGEEIEKIYNQLKKETWSDVLPGAFFLAKKLLKKKRGYLILSINSMLELKKMQLLSSYRGMMFKNLIRR